jgi:hypothetical protein
MTDVGSHQASSRVMLMSGNSVGLSVMLAEDVPTIARWNQDLEFTASIGTPGEAHTPRNAPRGLQSELEV